MQKRKPIQMNDALKEKIVLACLQHDEFKKQFPDIYKKTVNGAGPAKYGNLIRDSWFGGFSTTNAANVHDYLYSKFCDANSKEFFSRKDADNIFLELMKKDLSEQSTFYKVLNTPIVYAFWSSVRLFGFLFWKK